jgi:hypothetical protein
MQPEGKLCLNCSASMGEYDPALPPRFSRPVSELRRMARPVAPSETLQRWMLGLVISLGAVEIVVLAGTLAYFYL